MVIIKVTHNLGRGTVSLSKKLTNLCNMCLVVCFTVLSLRKNIFRRNSYVVKHCSKNCIGINIFL